ncbi:hypothetical protein MKW94_025126, partial [Papaver nudicaule]|nr:hypothetical protein [Papaver nudicaule]
MPASSYDAGVATSVDVDEFNQTRDKLIEEATREESYKHETDEDASSMSSVDYHYSEEDYWCSGEEDDDEEEDKEDDEVPISKLEKKDFVDS